MSCVRGCCPDQVTHFRSIAFAKTLPQQNKADTKLDRDRVAYKNFRNQGYQPKRVDDCADLEREAHDKLEVERAVLMKPEDIKAWRAAEERGREAEAAAIASGDLIRGIGGVRNRYVGT